MVCTAGVVEYVDDRLAVVLNGVRGALCGRSALRAGRDGVTSAELRLELDWYECRLAPEWEESRRELEVGRGRDGALSRRRSVRPDSRWFGVLMSKELMMKCAEGSRNPDKQPARE